MYDRVMLVLAVNFALCLAVSVFGVRLPVLSPIPHSLVGLPLGLLLVFRTNSACTRACVVVLLLAGCE
jgi:predicted membrane chloride channel (bestrophin family)